MEHDILATLNGLNINKDFQWLLWEKLCTLRILVDINSEWFYINFEMKHVRNVCIILNEKSAGGLKAMPFYPILQPNSRQN